MTIVAGVAIVTAVSRGRRGGRGRGRYAMPLGRLPVVPEVSRLLGGWLFAVAVMLVHRSRQSVIVMVAFMPA